MTDLISLNGANKMDKLKTATIKNYIYMNIYTHPYMHTYIFMYIYIYTYT